jgi:hypothetical protein
MQSSSKGRVPFVDSFGHSEHLRREFEQSPRYAYQGTSATSAYMAVDLAANRFASMAKQYRGWRTS